MFVHPIKPVRQSSTTDFQKSDVQLGKTFQHALKNNAGELLENTHRKGHGVDLCERVKHAGAEFVGVIAGAVHADDTAEVLSLFVDRIVKAVTQGQLQSHRLC